MTSPHPVAYRRAGSRTIDWTPDSRAAFLSAFGDKLCHECGRANPVWYTDNDLWNRVMGPDAETVLCPACFIGRAEAAGVGACDAWHLTPGPVPCGPEDV